MLTCFDVAAYFLSLADPDAGDLISNLKLQKLVYYAQGFYLALNDKPLFNEKMQAWAHGPVVPDLYHHYKKFGNDAITIRPKIDTRIFDKKVRTFLNDVYNVYGQFSAWKLRNMTHEEAPWIDAAPTSSLITHRALKSYFKTQLKNG